MKKYTGTIILLVITMIFGIDTVLSLGQHATISEWFSNWLNSGWQAEAIYFSVFTLLTAHFIGFKNNK